jgi:hypothetical protein
MRAATFANDDFAVQLPPTVDVIYDGQQRRLVSQNKFTRLRSQLVSMTSHSTVYLNLTEKVRFWCAVPKLKISDLVKKLVQKAGFDRALNYF